jgi:hypothetical protein
MEGFRKTVLTAGGIAMPVGQQCAMSTVSDLAKTERVSKVTRVAAEAAFGIGVVGALAALLALAILHDVPFYALPITAGGFALLGVPLFLWLRAAKGMDKTTVGVVSKDLQVDRGSGELEGEPNPEYLARARRLNGLQFSQAGERSVIRQEDREAFLDPNVSIGALFQRGAFLGRLGRGPMGGGSLRSRSLGPASVQRIRNRSRSSAGLASRP